MILKLLVYFIIIIWYTFQNSKINQIYLVYEIICF